MCSSDLEEQRPLQLNREVERHRKSPVGDVMLPGQELLQLRDVPHRGHEAKSNAISYSVSL